MHRKTPPENWSLLGGAEEEAMPEADEENFFCQKWYDSDYARFVDPPDDAIPEGFEGVECPAFCPSCHRCDEQEKVRSIS